MKIHKNHPFHLVDFSPWPILIALNTIIIIIRIIKWFSYYTNNFLLFRSRISILIIYQWWRDTIRERTYQGIHSLNVVFGLYWGIILFITSEVFFFISFFWRFFHNRLNPSIELGIQWPPINIITFNPISIPLLNTLILLTSGLTITWAHHSLLINNFKESMYRIFLTVILGTYFTILQNYEYIIASFSISDAIYGTIFFIATGFHGIHVIIGTSFLLICLIRHFLNHFSKKHHFGFEAAAWYWHFVDVVWLFLYISLYWWGKYLYSIIIIFDFQSKNQLKIV